jgi:hypothetical protein
LRDRRWVFPAHVQRVSIPCDCNHVDKFVSKLFIQRVSHCCSNVIANIGTSFGFLIAINGSTSPAWKQSKSVTKFKASRKRQNVL